MGEFPDRWADFTPDDWARYMDRFDRMCRESAAKALLPMDVAPYEGLSDEIAAWQSKLRAQGKGNDRDTIHA